MSALLYSFEGEESYIACIKELRSKRIPKNIRQTCREEAFIQLLKEVIRVVEANHTELKALDTFYSQKKTALMNYSMAAYDLIQQIDKSSEDSCESFPARHRDIKPRLKFSFKSVEEAKVTNRMPEEQKNILKNNSEGDGKSKNNSEGACTLKNNSDGELMKLS